MASTNPVNLSKIKKQLARKNIRIGGRLIFNKDASNKIFQLCKTANQKFLMLSFQNNPSEFLRYLRADEVLESQGLLTPRILEENKSLKYLLMDYYPTNNSSKYFKREEIKIILPRALQNIIHLQKNRKIFSGIPVKSQTNLMKDALKGIETYISYFDHKIQIGYYLNRLIQISLKKNLEKITRIFFSQRRKMLKKPFNQVFANGKNVAEKFGIDLNLRPQNLEPETYFKLVKEYEDLRG